MKGIIPILLLLMFSCHSGKQDREATIDYLKFAIESNPPFDGVEAKFDYNESDCDLGDTFDYVVEMDTDGVKKTRQNTIYLNEIKNIVLTESSYGLMTKYHLRLGLKEGEEFHSFYAITHNETPYVQRAEEVLIVLPHKLELAEKVKKAFIHLGELYDVEVKDLDTF